MTTFVGIDPGKSGAIAALLDTPIAKVMPVVGGHVDVGPMADWIEESVMPFGKFIIVVEDVHAMPQQGVASSFKFGSNYGKVVGMCQAKHWPFQLVTPQAWKKHVLTGTLKDKDAAIAFASRMYPTLNLKPGMCRKEHDGVADAVCMAHFAKYLMGGKK